MKRTPLKRKTELKPKSQILRATKLNAKRRKKRRTAAVNLAATERKERFDALARMGCIVCRNETYGIVAPEIHHCRGFPWSGAGQKASDAHTLPLCVLHHRTGDGRNGFIGYHHSPAEFEARYGTQAELLEQVDRIIQRMREAA